MNKMISVLVLLAACSVPYPKACEKYEALYCDTCELSANEKTYCKCMEEKILTASDFPDGYDMTNNDAQVQCDAWLNAVEFPGPSQSSYCKQALELLKNHGNELCATIPDSGGG